MEGVRKLSYTKMLLKIEEEREKREEDVVDGCCSRVFGCNGDIQDWRSKYVRIITSLWVLILGPLCGFLGACDYIQKTCELLTVITMVYFLTTLLSSQFSGFRLMNRLWILVGILWVASGWYKYHRREFGDDLENFFNLALIGSISWGVSVLVPLTLTDPAFINCCQLISAV
ncbi:uncharacterized protein LOC111705312 [Eurytemora carolleeae]|uniref:uncharacterized protein LOC111705312 n=1 Tax=Eurytemora carolleeae TaxID=1294199 RepID=UPI000C770FEB|nr:uncharacterized protein LOC111705312 [Eurytemora carolleeae]|eukprot:XP_023333582.1 uncharacterized protein LOC111705312 [Eurytemora affinis]